MDGGRELPQKNNSKPLPKLKIENQEPSPAKTEKSVVSPVVIDMANPVGGTRALEKILKELEEDRWETGKAIKREGKVATLIEDLRAWIGEYEELPKLTNTRGAQVRARKDRLTRILRATQGEFSAQGISVQFKGLPTITEAVPQKQTMEEVPKGVERAPESADINLQDEAHVQALIGSLQSEAEALEKMRVAGRMSAKEEAINILRSRLARYLGANPAQRENLLNQIANAQRTYTNLGGSIVAPTINTQTAVAVETNTGSNEDEMEKSPAGRKKNQKGTNAPEKKVKAGPANKRTPANKPDTKKTAPTVDNRSNKRGHTASVHADGNAKVYGSGNVVHGDFHNYVVENNDRKLSPIEEKTLEAELEGEKVIRQSSVQKSEKPMSAAPSTESRGENVQPSTHTPPENEPVFRQNPTDPGTNQANKGVRKSGREGSMDDLKQPGERWDEGFRDAPTNTETTEETPKKRKSKGGFAVEGSMGTIPGWQGVQPYTIQTGPNPQKKEKSGIQEIQIGTGIGYEENDPDVRDAILASGGDVIPPAPGGPWPPKDLEGKPKTKTGEEFLRESFASPEIADLRQKVGEAYEAVSKERSLWSRVKGRLKKRSPDENSPLQTAQNILTAAKKKYAEAIAKKTLDAVVIDRKAHVAMLAEEMGTEEADQEAIQKEVLGFAAQRSRGLTSAVRATEMLKLADARTKLALDRFEKKSPYSKAFMRAAAWYGKLPLTARVAVGASGAVLGALLVTGASPILAGATAGTALLASTGVGRLNTILAKGWAARRQVDAEKGAAEIDDSLLSQDLWKNEGDVLGKMKASLFHGLETGERDEAAQRKERKIKVFSILGTSVVIGGVGLGIRFSGADAILPTPNAPRGGVVPQTSDNFDVPRDQSHIVPQTSKNFDVPRDSFAGRRGVAPNTEPPSGSIRDRSIWTGDQPTDTPNPLDKQIIPPAGSAPKDYDIFKGPGVDPRMEGPGSWKGPGGAPTQPDSDIGLAEPSDRAFPNETDVPPRPIDPIEPNPVEPPQRPQEPSIIEDPPSPPIVPKGPQFGEYTVKSGDNLWNIISKKLQEGGTFDGLTDAQKNAMIQGYEDKLWKLPQAQREALGFGKGDLNRIYPDTKLDLRLLNEGSTPEIPAPTTPRATVAPQSTTPRVAAAPQPPEAPIQTPEAPVIPQAPSPAEIRTVTNSLIEESVGRKGPFKAVERWVGGMASENLSNSTMKRFTDWVAWRKPSMFVGARPGAIVQGIDANDVLKVRATLLEGQSYGLNINSFSRVDEAFKAIAQARLSRGR